MHTNTSVVSATVSRASSAEGKRDRFLAAADGFLAQAHEELEAGREDIALEQAYLAALRIAGAVCATAPAIRKRRRLPTSAWDKLAITGADGKRWAGTFRQYSALRGRVASGIQREVPAARVAELLGEAERFYEFARPDFGTGAPLVA
ncbi:SAV_6107 family HEPN domain-containing protein [Corynebacterium sp. HMSC074A01]|uniref:SAV_6107 family HEPN domain-containing protein n=1 Tax=Corynebacterium sp. HMSC074A01 TaxID=1715030 RepID=UPI0008A4947E|nr:SAV_6107 family HEPN domain-containing protein [Corynebacterium sp. HMSC074A01]OHF36261.1 hypothetical protein HMPREF2550_09225 [Corynebacterium sp. HMSC074A01]